MNSFIFFWKKVGKTVSGTCRYYPGKRYKCDRKRDEKEWVRSHMQPSKSSKTIVFPMNFNDSPNKACFMGFSRLLRLVSVLLDFRLLGTENKWFSQTFYRHRRLWPPFKPLREGSSPEPLSTKRLRESFFSSSPEPLSTKRLRESFFSRSWLPHPGFQILATRS